MLLIRRKSGSQRPMRDLEAVLVPVADRTTTGITFLAGGIYYTLEPQTDQQALELIDDVKAGASNRRKR